MNTKNTVNINTNDNSLRGETSKFISPSTKMATQITTTMFHDGDGSTSRMADDSHSSDTRKWVAPLPSLPSCPSWWQLVQSRARATRRRFPDTNRSVCEEAYFSGTIRLPVLPHTTLVSEILPFCDESTLMTFRGVSKEFRDFEIPREFHYRAMNKIESSNEKNNQKQKRQQTLLSTALPDAVRYSYKKKVLDELNRKVWIFLRERSEKKQTDNGDSETASSRVLSKTNTFESHPHLWSLQTVTSKVLKLMRDIEFYNGSVYGYDQDRARKLMLEKGWIDNSDFEQPKASLKSLLKKNLYGTSDQEEYPVYGKWRAEASVREVSLNEALEILSDNTSTNQGVCKSQRRWRSPFRRRKDNQSSNQKISVQKLIRPDSGDEKLGLSILLAASGNDSSLSGDSLSECASDGVSIRLAEYSTVFEKTKMSCSILLVRTFGGAEAEVRVLSGRCEPHSRRSSWHFQRQPSGKGLSLSRHSTNSI